jgi:hypothetical protein
VHRLPIHIGQRYSAIVTTNQSTATNYWLRAAMVTYCFTGDNPVLDPTTRAVVSYSGGNNTVFPLAEGDNASVDWADAYGVKCHDLDPSELVPSERMVPPAATRFWRVDFSFGIGAYQMDYAKVNGTTWKPLEGTTTLIEAVDGLAMAGASGDGIGSGFATSGVVSGFGENQFVVGVSNASVEVVDVLIYSLDEGAHPFHLHGHDFVSPP